MEIFVFSIFCALCDWKSAVNYEHCLFIYSAVLAGAGKIPTSAHKELRLIQSKSDIENPRIVVEAVPLICRMFPVILFHIDDSNILHIHDY